MFNSLQLFNSSSRDNRSKLGTLGKSCTLGLALFLLVAANLNAQSETEPNNDFGQADFLIPGMSAEISPEGDVDFFRFNASSTECPFTFETSNLTGGLDTFITLYDQNQNFLADDDDGGTDFASKIVWTFSSGGGIPTYVKVEGFAGFGPTGGYNISVDSPQGRTLSRSPSSMTFSATQGDPNSIQPQNQNLSITHAGACETLNWNLSANQSWVNASLISGSLSAGQTANVTVSVNISGLPPGTHTATITVGVQNSNQFLDTQVTLIIASGIPTAPSNLQATAVSANQINLTWNDNSNNETNFRIERRVGGGGFSFLVSVGANTTNYTDNAVSPNTNYTYRVRAESLVGSSSFSNEASATTPDIPPAAPSNLQASAISTNQINLTWSDNSNNETQFRIERRVGGGGFSFLVNVGANTQNYSDTALAPATTYTYRVRAENSAGSSSFSNEASATTIALPRISRSPSSMTFNATEGGSNPPSQTLQITNTGGGTLNWEVAVDQSWVSLSSTTGSSTGETDNVTVSVNIAGLSAGTHTATISYSI